MTKKFIFVLFEKELEKKGWTNAEFTKELQNLRKFYKENSSIVEYEKLKNKNNLELINTKEACALIRKSISSINRYIEEGMPVITKGKGCKRLFVKMEIVNWNNANKL